MSVRPLIVLTGIAVVVAGACVEVREDENGDATGVAISTPVGGLVARTGESAGDTGLPVYPAAQPARNTREDDADRANVSIGTPWFGLHVIAAEYESLDSAERVLGFYRREMTAFGPVTECRGDIDFENNRAGCRSQESSVDVHLVTGTEEHHRIVSVRPRREGSEFALVSVQLGR